MTVLILAAVAAVPEDVSVTQVVMSGIMLAMLAVATALVMAISGRSKRTEDAVHTADGTSVSEQLTRLEGRVSSNEQRMTNQATRIDRNEQSVAAAHRRIDTVVGDLATMRVNHEGRLVAAETAIHDLQTLPGD